jgi:hypothetical protein
MSTAIYSPPVRQNRDALDVRRDIRAAATRAACASVSAIKEGREIMLTLAASLTLMVAVLALDVWIWVPRLGH